MCTSALCVLMKGREKPVVMHTLLQAHSLTAAARACSSTTQHSAAPSLACNRGSPARCFQHPRGRLAPRGRGIPKRDRSDFRWMPARPARQRCGSRRRGRAARTASARRSGRCRGRRSRPSVDRSPAARPSRAEEPRCASSCLPEHGRCQRAAAAATRAGERERTLEHVARLRDGDGGSPVEDALVVDRQRARRASAQHRVAVLVALLLLRRRHAAVLRARHHFTRAGLRRRVLREVEHLEKVELRAEQAVRILVPCGRCLHGLRDRRRRLLARERALK